MLRPIVLYPDPRLRLKSKPITQFGPEFHQLVLDMTETMRHANGVGLAAIQIGEPIRMMVMDERYDQEDKGEALVLFNPQILQEEGSETTEEGCLSIPDVREEVERSFKVKVRYQDLNGQEQVSEFEGLLARCVLHEIDHMDGQLFIQKIPAVKKLFLQRQLNELKKNYKATVSL
jgi:peptide deformylase